MIFFLHADRAHIGAGGPAVAAAGAVAARAAGTRAPTAEGCCRGGGWVGIGLGGQLWELFGTLHVVT